MRLRAIRTHRSMNPDNSAPTKNPNGTCLPSQSKPSSSWMDTEIGKTKDNSKPKGRLSQVLQRFIKRSKGQNSEETGSLLYTKTPSGYQNPQPMTDTIGRKLHSYNRSFDEADQDEQECKGTRLNSVLQAALIGNTKQRYSLVPSDEGDTTDDSSDEHASLCRSEPNIKSLVQDRAFLDDIYEKIHVENNMDRSESPILGLSAHYIPEITVTGMDSEAPESKLPACEPIPEAAMYPDLRRSSFPRSATETVKVPSNRSSITQTASDELFYQSSTTSPNNCSQCLDKQSKSSLSQQKSDRAKRNSLSSSCESNKSGHSADSFPHCNTTTSSDRAPMINSVISDEPAKIEQFELCMRQMFDALGDSVQKQLAEMRSTYELHMTKVTELLNYHDKEIRQIKEHISQQPHTGVVQPWDRGDEDRHVTTRL